MISFVLHSHFCLSQKGGVFTGQQIHPGEKLEPGGRSFSLSLYDHVVLNTLDLFIQPGWDSHWQDHTRAMEKCHGTRTEACLVASYLDLKQLNRYHSHRCNWNRSFTSLRLVRLAESNFGGCLPKGRICHLHTSLRWSHSRKVQVIQLSFILCEV